MKKFAVLCVVCVIAAGAVAADMDQLEQAVTEAKAAHVADPSARNLASLEQAAAVFQAGVVRVKGLKAVATETEPNNTAATANPVADGDYIAANLTPFADIDYFGNSGNSVQDLVYAAVVTAASSTGTDSELSVFADDGVTLIEYDDDGGPGLASCVAGGIVPQAGAVIFLVNELGNNTQITPYELHQVVAPPSDAVSEVEPNNDTATATPIAATFVDGFLPVGAVDVDFFSFPATAGDLIEVIVDEDPDGGGNGPNTQLSLLDTDGVTVLANGDNQLAGLNNCAGSALAPSTGTYFVRVGDGTSGSDETYRFTVVIDGRGVPVELTSFAIE